MNLFLAMNKYLGKRQLVLINTIIYIDEEETRHSYRTNKRMIEK